MKLSRPKWMQVSAEPNVFWLGMVSFFNDVASEMIYPLLPLFLTVTLGAGPVALGTIEGAAEATAGIFKLASGAASDRWQRRKAIFCVGYALSNALRPLTGLATVWGHVFALRVGDRVGKGVRTAPRDALLAASVEEGALGRAFGFQRAMDNAGAMVGPLLAAALLPPLHQNYRVLFGLSAIPGAVALVLVLALVREVRPSRPPVAEPSEAPANPGPGAAALWPVLAAVALFSLGNSSDAFLLLRASNLGVAVPLIPVLWAVHHLSKAAFALPGGALADARGRARTILLGWLVYALVYVGFAFASRALHIWLLFIGYGLYFGLTEGAERALVGSLGRGKRLGTWYGTYHLAVAASSLFASLLFGAVWKAFGPSAAFLMGAGLAGAAGILLSLSRVR